MRRSPNDNSSSSESDEDAYQKVADAATTVNDAQKQIISLANDAVKAKKELSDAKDHFAVTGISFCKVATITKQLDSTRAQAADLASTANTRTVDSGIQKLRRHVALAQALAKEVAPILPPQLLGTDRMARLEKAVTSA